jgi:hypothetical protein
MQSVLRVLKVSAVPLLLTAVVVGLLFWPEPPRDDTSGAADYTCSMHPQVRLPKGQKCPLCGMDLVPVSQLSALQAQLEERAGVQTEAVKYRELFRRSAPSAASTTTSARWPLSPRASPAGWTVSTRTSPASR